MFGRKVIDDEDFEIESKYSIFNIIGLIFALILLPAYLIAIITESVLFRKLRIKWSILIPIQIFVFLINFLIIKNINFIDKFGSLLGYYITIIFLTLPFIVIYKVLKDAFLLKSYPEFKGVKGWTKNFEYSTTLIEKLRKERLKKECLEGKVYDDNKAPLGVLDEPVKLDDTKYRKPEIVFKYYDEAEKHSIITGAPGSGKTVDMLNQLYNDMLNKRPILMIDNKGAVDVTYFLSKWAKEMGRDFYHFSPGYHEEYSNPYNDKKATYDPFATGNTTYVSETILDMIQYDVSAEIYKQTSRSVLGTITFLLDNVKQSELPQIPWSAGKIAQILAALEPPNLYALINNFKNKLALKEVVGELEKSNLESAEGLYNAITKNRDETGKATQAQNYRSLLNGLLASSYGEWLVNTKNSKIINLEQLLNDKNGPVILFSLKQQEDKDFARIIGGMVLSNLNQISSARQNLNKEGLMPCSIYVDEIQTLPIDDLADMLEKARSSRMPMMLSLQTLEQITKAGYDESFITSVIDNTSNFIVHQGPSEDAALRYSKIIGQREFNKISHSAKLKTWLFSPWWYKIGKRDITNSQDKEYIIEPEKFQTLSAPRSSNGWKSTAYYISKTCSDPLFEDNLRTVARKFQSIVPTEITDGVPQDFQYEYNKLQGKVKRDNQKLVDKIRSGSKISLKQKQEENKRKTKKMIKPQKSNKSLNDSDIKSEYKKENSQSNKKLIDTQKQLSEYEKKALSNLNKKKFKPKDKQGLPDLNDL